LAPISTRGSREGLTCVREQAGRKEEGESREKKEVAGSLIRSEKKKKGKPRVLERGKEKLSEKGQAEKSRREKRRLTLAGTPQQAKRERGCEGVKDSTGGGLFEEKGWRLQNRSS